MKKAKSIGINTIWHMMGMLVRVLYPVITYPYAARVLMPTNMGRYSFASSVTGYFALFASLGISVYAMRSCAACAGDREQLKERAAELLALNIMTSFCAGALLCAAVFVIPAMVNDRGLFLLLGLVIVFNCLGMDWLFQAMEEYAYLTAVSTISRVISLVSLFVMVRTEQDIIPYAGVSLLHGGVTCLCNLLAVHVGLGYPVLGTLMQKLLGDERKEFLRRVWTHFRPVFLFFLMSCAVNIYTNLDTVMLGFLRDIREVGLYDAAAKVKSALVLFSTALWHTALPRSSQCWKEGDFEGFCSLGRRSLSAVVMIQIPAALFLCLFAWPCIRIIAGEAYEGAVLPMRILCLSVWPIGISNILGGQLLISMGRETDLFYGELFGAVSNLILNALLIPVYGAVGAAATTLLSETIVTVWAFAALKRYLPGRFLPDGSDCRALMREIVKGAMRYLRLIKGGQHNELEAA